MVPPTTAHMVIIVSIGKLVEHPTDCSGLLWILKFGNLNMQLSPLPSFDLASGSSIEVILKSFDLKWRYE